MTPIPRMLYLVVAVMAAHYMFTSAVPLGTRLGKLAAAIIVSIPVAVVWEYLDGRLP